MKTLTRQGIQRMTTGGTTVVGGSGSGSGGSGGGSADYAAEAGHAQTADEATHATSADSATTATNLDANSTDWEKIARKDIAQSIAEIFTFAKGIVSTLVSKFKAGIKIGANDEYQIDANGNASLRDISGRKIQASDDSSIGGDLDVVGNVGIESDLTVEGNITAAQVIAKVLKDPNFVAAVSMIGKGFGVTVDANGKSTLQTDDLLVLGQMIVNSLNIREVSYIGGTFLLTPAGSTVAKVMPLYADSTSHIQYAQYWSTTESYYQVGYRLMWKADDGSVGTMNYWQAGDQAYCHTYNVTPAGSYTTAANRHYWRLVVRIGTKTVDGETFHYADVADQSYVYLPGETTQRVGCENTNGSVPAEGDKVVCLGSQTDSTRRGAVQITAEGESSIGIYDGINNYTSLSNFEIHYLSKTIVRMRSDKFTWRSYGGTLRTQANFESGISQAGIDIDNGEINLIAGKVNFLTSGGQANPKINIDPGTGTLNAVDGNFDGTVTAKVLKQVVSEAYPSIDGLSVNVLTIDPEGGDLIFALYYHTAFDPGSSSAAAQYVEDNDIQVGDIFYVNESIIDSFDTSNFYVTIGFATHVVITDQYYMSGSSEVKSNFPANGVIRIPQPSYCTGIIITFVNTSESAANIVCAGHETENLFYQSINRYPEDTHNIRTYQAVINGGIYVMYADTVITNAIPQAIVKDTSGNNRNVVALQDGNNYLRTRFENNVVRLYSNGTYWIVLDGKAV